MAKKKNIDFTGVSVLIRNMEASLLYYLGTEQNKEHKKMVTEYCELCSKQSQLQKSIKDIKEKMSTGEADMSELVDPQSQRTEIINKIKLLGKEVFRMDKSFGCSLKGKDNRYYYKGNLTDSLIRRELVDLINKKSVDSDKFRPNDSENPTLGYGDIIINVSFKKDYMVKDPTAKNGTFLRNIINNKKLRDIFYRDGVWINGTHYVEFQRSSSKARTGDCLFIKEQYLEEMLSWQRLGLNFKREILKADGSSHKKPKYIKIDITGERAYESLVSSSIIGEVNIDPYNILLIDDIAGKHTMKCNLVDLVEYKEVKMDGDEEKINTEIGLGVSEQDYTQKTDMWDGQSLVDESVFDCTYMSRNREGKLVEHTFKDKGFLLLREHFMKSAGFNTKLREWFASDKVQKVLPVNENGVKCAVDRFGNLLPSDKIQMVTTKNSIKIFKEPFATCIIYDEVMDKGTIKKSNGDRYTENDLADLGNYQVDKYENKVWKWNKNAESIIWDWYRLKVKSVMGDRMGVCKYEKSSKFLDGLYQQLAYQMLNSLGFTKEDIEKLTEPQINEIMQSKNSVAFFKHLIDTRGNSSAKQSMMLALLDVNDKIENTQLYKDYKDEQIQRLIDRIIGGKILTENSDYCVLFGNPYEMLLASSGMLESEDGIAIHSIMGSQEQTERNQFECYCKKFKDSEELWGFRSPHICESNAVYLLNKKHEEYQWFNALTLSDNIVAVNFQGFGAFLAPKWMGCDCDSDQVLLGNDEIVLKRVIEAQKKLLPINGIEPEPTNLPFTEENLALTDNKLANDFIGRICNMAQNLQSYYWHLYNTRGADAKYLNDIYNDVCILSVASGIAIDNSKRRYPVNLENEIRRLKKRDYLYEVGAIIEDDSIIFKFGEEKKEKTYMKIPKFMAKKRKSDKRKCPKDATDEVKVKIEKHNQSVKELEKRLPFTFDTPMDMIEDVIRAKIKKARDVSPICICEILNDIPSGDKADYNRMTKIIEKTLEKGKELYDIQEQYKNHAINGETLFEQKKAVELKAIDEFSKIKVDTNDIIQLIKKVYYVTYKKKGNGHYEYDEKHRKIIDVDKRDRTLIETKMGSRMLQWLYVAHTDDFIAAIKHSGMGTITHLVDVTDFPEDKIPTEVFKLYNRKYIEAKQIDDNYEIAADEVEFVLSDNTRIVVRKKSVDIKKVA